MKINEFLCTLDQDLPPDGLSPELQALWWAKKGDWTEAHDLIQNADSKDSEWIHAHLHRVEGDLDNANYWYLRSGRFKPTKSFELEWTEIVSELLKRSVPQ